MDHQQRTLDPRPHAAARIDARVLVGYATRHGSTQGVAERIAGTLQSHGVQVDLRRVDEVEAVARYDAVVFGSPVYDGRWVPEGDAFVRDNLAALAVRAVWLFSVGSFGDRR